MTLLEAAKQAVAAPEKMGYPFSPAMWQNVGDPAPANNRAAEECLALHRASIVLAEAVQLASKMVEKINTDDGSVVVPVTPTPAMLARMVEVYEDISEDGKISDSEVMTCVWEAALATAKEGGER